MTPGTIRAALGTRLRSISGLTVYDRWPSGGLNPPCAVVAVGPSEPEQVFGRGDLTRWEFPVSVFVAMAPGLDQAQRNLDLYLATSSTGGIFGAIAADRTLGGAVDTVIVRGWRDYEPVEQAPELLGATCDLEVWGT